MIDDIWWKYNNFPVAEPIASENVGPLRLPYFPLFVLTDSRSHGITLSNSTKTAISSDDELLQAADEAARLMGLELIVVSSRWPQATSSCGKSEKRCWFN